MATHPYISGAGNVSQMVALLRKNFPATVTSETVKKVGLAPNNESYVINALQFIGAIDESGKKTDIGGSVFNLHKEEEFQVEFAKLVETAYSDLFELRGELSWDLNRDDLISYFRTTDKTSSVIGTRQAAMFETFASLAGHGRPDAPAKSRSDAKPRVGRSSPAQKERGATKQKSSTERSRSATEPPPATTNSRDMALTVRIEINLPAGGSRSDYDNIFKSIRANLLDE